MSFTMRFFPTLILGSAMMMASCGVDPGDAETPTDMPLLSSLAGPSGATGSNGLSTLSWALYKNALFTSSQSPLAQSSTGNEHAIALTNSNITLLGSPSGREVLEYAARCGLNDGDWVTAESPSQTFQGGGLLTTTGGWKTSGLSKPQQEDLFTCLIAHLNLYNVEVPIALSGPSVVNRPDDTSLFTFSEAVWVTKITKNILTGAPMIEYDVWPQVNLSNLCGTLVSYTLGARVCGVGLLCGLVVRTDFTSACTSTESGWYCDGRPAIETRLTQPGAALLHPLCGH